MNRRSFFSSLAKAAAGFAILPAATTYARNWKIISCGSPAINPAWETAEYEISWLQYGKNSAWFKYYARPLHFEYARTYFHQREALLIPEDHLTKSSAGLISPPAMQVAPPPALHWKQPPTA